MVTTPQLSGGAKLVPFMTLAISPPPSSRATPGWANPGARVDSGLTEKTRAIGKDRRLEKKSRGTGRRSLVIVGAIGPTGFHERSLRRHTIGRLG